MEMTNEQIDLLIVLAVVLVPVALILMRRDPEHMSWPCTARGAAWDRATGKKMYDFKVSGRNVRETTRKLGREHAIRTIEWRNKHWR